MTAARRPPKKSPSTSAKKRAAKKTTKKSPATSRKASTPKRSSNNPPSPWREAASRRGAAPAKTGEAKNPSPKPAAAPKLTPALRKRLAAIRLLILDVDGTLTDGTVWLGESDEFKGFNIADGLGIKALMRCGVEVAIVTGRESAAVTRRARELGIEHLFQKTRDKTRCVGILQRRLGLERDALASMGDDLPDFQMFNACAFNFAPADAAPELAAAADIVTTRPGGHGAVREAAELILKARGDWTAVVDRFRKS